MANTPKYCEETFERMVDSDPEGLVALLSGDQLESYLLTYAADYAGRIPNQELVTPKLLNLLEHPEPVVREGAIYGLMRQYESNPELPYSIATKFKELSSSDPSQTIRELLCSILENEFG